MHKLKGMQCVPAHICKWLDQDGDSISDAFQLFANGLAWGSLNPQNAVALYKVQEACFGVLRCQEAIMCIARQQMCVTWTASHMHDTDMT